MLEIILILIQKALSRFVAKDVAQSVSDTKKRSSLCKTFYFQGRPVCHNKISQMDFLILPRYEKFLDEQSMCVKIKIKMESLKSAHKFLKFTILLAPSLILVSEEKVFT